MGCKPLDDIAHSGHRNIKISGDGLVALRLSMFFHNFFLSNPQTTLFSILSVTHNTKVESTLSSSFLSSVWNFIKFDFSSVYCVVAVQTKTISMGIPKHLQLEQFSERSVAFSDRIARVPIFLAMTVCHFIWVTVRDHLKNPINSSFTMYKNRKLVIGRNTSIETL